VTRILVWDRRSSGHHPAYLSAVVDAGVARGTLESLILPRWAEALGESVGATPLFDDSQTLRESVVRHNPTEVILLDGHDEVPNLLRWRFGVEFRVVDIRSQHVFRAGATRRSSITARSRAAAHRVLREAACRRNSVRFLCLENDTASVGSSRLRRQTDPLPELKQAAPAQPAPRATPTGRQRIVLAGSLDDRKGIELTLEALKMLDSRERSRLQLEIVGKPREARYGRQLEAIVDSAIHDGLPVTADLRRLDEEELQETVLSARIVLLPYLDHRGGSGLLSMLDGYHGAVVASDFGWLGQLAREAGAFTFRNGEASSLAASLVLVSTIPRSTLRLPSKRYRSALEFGDVVLGGTT
jgi:glycosyltransferase involved in cell wall biosynthesis